MSLHDIQQIQEFLPHRYPFLLVDRVNEIDLEHEDGPTIRALKNVTINEDFFNGHFPGHPIMPGVLTLEAMAQSAGILGLTILGHEKAANTLYYFASRILQTPMQFITLFMCMGISVAYLGYLAIEDVAKFPDTTDYIDHDTGRWQGLGYYANSNEFGQLMITTVPFLLAAILIRKSIFLAALSVALMSLMFFVMIKSESRTVMVTLGLMFMGTFMLRGKGNIVKKAIVGGTMAVIMLVALSFTPGPIQERMSTVLDANNDESFQGRTRSWDHGFAMLSWYPITGVGKGQWMEYHGLMPHNSYVQVMAEMGIFGIVLYLMIIWRSLLQFKRIIKTDEATPNTEPPKSLFDDESNHEPSFEAFHPMGDIHEDHEQTEANQPVLTNVEKTVAIAGFVTFAGWLLYIFLGNQAYSIWMYFYLGLCAAYANYLGQPDPEEETNSSVFEERATT